MCPTERPLDASPRPMRYDSFQMDSKTDSLQAIAPALHEDVAAWLAEYEGQGFDLHSKHINPVFVKMLRTIGFDKGYVRGEGCHLWDAEGNKYLDLLTGWGVFALGRNHPKVKAILTQIINQDLPNLVRMD